VKVITKVMNGRLVSASSQSVVSADKESERFFLIRLYPALYAGIPMRVSDSSVGGEASQFHTTRWTVVMVSAREQSQMDQAVLAALCNLLIATRGRLGP
jgi:hypothetical protein